MTGIESDVIKIAGFPAGTRYLGSCLSPPLSSAVKCQQNLVGFGESIKFKGSGFSDGVTANLYAQPGTGSDVCTNAGGGSWTNIGSTNVGSDHRFESDVEISTNVFRSAGKYLVCAADGS